MTDYTSRTEPGGRDDFDTDNVDTTYRSPHDGGTARDHDAGTQPIDPRPPTLPPREPQRRRRVPMIAVIALVALIAAAIAYPAGQRSAESDEQAGQQAAAAQAAPQDEGDAADGTAADGTADDAADTDMQAALDAPSAIPEIADTVLPSVAMVDTGGGAGSAVIYRDDGYLITNNHVIANAGPQLQVVLADGQRRDAEVVGTAPFTDIAVVKIDETGLPAAEFSDAVPRIGETAVAIGSPFGLDATVTAGVISATDRELPTPGNQPSLGNLLQTDAAINPGNSGGALADNRGRIIGINTAILSGSGTNSGVGFAVPSTTVIAVADQLIETGEVSPGFLGISGQPVTPQAAEAFGVPEGAVVVEVVPGSPADEAGLQAEDVIIGFGDAEIDSMLGLSSRVQTRQPGDEVSLTYVRDGEEQQTTVTLGSRNEAQTVPTG